MPDRTATLTLTNDLAEVARLAAFVDAFCAPLAPAERDLMALHLVLEEVVTNVVRHGYRDGAAHTFTVALAVAPDRRVTAVVTDDAPAYDPLARPEVDVTQPLEEREIGGLGVHLVKKLMDSAHYERRDGHNVLTLARTFAPAA
jgi:anti-sigma regulatory factor (Ser/Thr protein kinase)